MRPTIVLLSPLDDHRELVARLHRAGSYSEEAFFDRLDRGGCSFGVDASGDVLDDFDEEEIAEISERLGEFGAILLEYPDVSCIRDLLTEVIQGVDGLLDTNYGEFLEYGNVLARFQRDPSWDWRTAVAE